LNINIKKGGIIKTNNYRKGQIWSIKDVSVCSKIKDNLILITSDIEPYKKLGIIRVCLLTKYLHRASVTDIILNSQEIPKISNADMVKSKIATLAITDMPFIIEDLGECVGKISKEQMTSVSLSLKHPNRDKKIGKYFEIFSSSYCFRAIHKLEKT